MGCFVNVEIKEEYNQSIGVFKSWCSDIRELNEEKKAYAILG